MSAHLDGGSFTGAASCPGFRPIRPCPPHNRTRSHDRIGAFWHCSPGRAKWTVTSRHVGPGGTAAARMAGVGRAGVDRVVARAAGRGACRGALAARCARGVLSALRWLRRGRRADSGRLRVVSRQFGAHGPCREVERLSRTHARVGAGHQVPVLGGDGREPGAALGERRCLGAVRRRMLRRATNNSRAHADAVAAASLQAH